MTTATRIARATFSIERHYPASIEEAWELWTTKAGIESWWGPEGFDVTVDALDLKPGGELVYRMRATGAEQVAFMKQAGMPLTSQCKVTFAEITPPRLLVYKTRTDFIPGVEAYEVATVVRLAEIEDGVKLTITSDAMHDEVWTSRARAGHESQLRKLGALIAKRQGAKDHEE